MLIRSRTLGIPFALVLAAVLTPLPAAPPQDVRPYSAQILQAVEKIRAEIDQEGLSFEVGPNAAMQYDLAQLCGLRPELPVPAEFREHEPGGRHGYLPQSLVSGPPSNAFYGWSSSVKNQGSCGDCWAFGTLGALEGSYLRTHGAPALAVSPTTGAITISGSSPDLSEQQLTSCNPWNWGCNGGNVAFNMLMPTNTGAGYYPGAVPEACFPFVAANVACHICSSPTYTPVNTWGYLTSDTTIPTVAAIKAAIQTYGCVSAYVYADNTFQAYKSGVYTSKKHYKWTNHEIVLCGWDDAKQAWLLKNSWGPTWGINGFMWIAYSANRVGEGTAWCTTD